MAKHVVAQADNRTPKNPERLHQTAYTVDQFPPRPNQGVPSPNQSEIRLRFACPVQNRLKQFHICARQARQQHSIGLVVFVYALCDQLQAPRIGDDHFVPERPK